MTNDTEDKKSRSGLDGYKTPIKKLAESFKNSRDQLRKKYNELKNTIKSYTIKIRDLTNSRDKWKKVAKKLEKDLKELREEKREAEKKSRKRKPHSANSKRTFISNKNYFYGNRQHFKNICRIPCS